MPASWAEAKAALPQLPIPVMLFLPEHGQLHVLMVPIPSHIGFLLQSITFTVASMASEQEIKNCRLLNGGCFGSLWSPRTIKDGYIPACEH